VCRTSGASEILSYFLLPALTDRPNLCRASCAGASGVMVGVGLRESGSSAGLRFGEERIGTGVVVAAWRTSGAGGWGSWELGVALRAGSFVGRAALGKRWWSYRALFCYGRGLAVGGFLGSALRRAA
jgi:hypothetical protein